MNDGRLIDLVQSYSYLYDRKRSDFKDVRKKDLAWAEIGKLLGYSDEECKRRWLYLREKYVKEKNGKASGSEAGKQWDLFNSMRWLDMYIMKRKTKSNCSQNESTSQDTIEIVEDDTSVNYEAEEQVTERNTSPVFLSEVYPSSSLQAVSYPKRKKGNTENEAAQVLESFQNMGNTFNNIATKVLNSKVVDEDDHFSNLVNSFLKKHKDSKKKKQFKKMVFNAIMDYSDSD
ncbi:hypothetical protein FQR65_LT20103 [Abscondita terminalis]|nr:hypothetical protein FQR65_LT20103 [Abscondita terminalis]